MSNLGQLSKETLDNFVNALAKAGTTTGINTSSDLNFYYLEPGVKTLVPIFHPLLDRTPRYTPTIAGQPVGGLGVNYKAIISVDAAGYPGLPEKARGQFIAITTENFFAAYKYFGKDTFVTFAAEQTGLGLDDNIRLSQWSLLAAMLNDVERMLIYGNSGSTGNGFQLGTPSAPTVTLSATGNGFGLGTGFANGTSVDVSVVALTGWGTRLAVSSTGLTPTKNVTTADGTNYTYNQGTSAVSPSSLTVTTTTGTPFVKATAVPVAGAVAYAWFVGTGASGSPAQSIQYFLTTTPCATITVGAAAPNTNQTASNAVLTADASSSTYDFDGVISWVANSQTVGSPAYINELYGAGFTNNGDGTVQELETAMEIEFQGGAQGSVGPSFATTIGSQGSNIGYKITFDEIFVAPDAIGILSTAILKGNSSQSARLNFFTDDAGNLTGGTLVTEYRSRYAPLGGAKTLPVTMLPWAPDGTVLLMTFANPYPEAANAIPACKRVACLLDFFSIKWPYRNLSHELGVYLFATLVNYIPFADALLTGATQ